MEAERDPLGQRDLCDVTAIEVLCVEHDEFGGVLAEVVDEGDQPSVVFGGTGLTPDEDRFTGRRARTVIERGACTGVEVSTPTSKDLVLAAALAVLRRDDASGLRVRAVATEAGCSTTGIYTNFGSKNGLVEAIFVDGFERLDTALASAPTTGSWAGRLRARCVEYRRWALANSTSYMVMFGGAVPEFSPGPGAARRGFQTFTDLVERVRAAIDADEFAPGDPTAVAYHVWATKHGYVMLEVARMNGRTAKEAEAIYAAGMTRLFDGLARTT